MGQMVAGGMLATRVERFAGALIDGVIGLAIGAPLGIGLALLLMFVAGMEPTGIAYQVVTPILGSVLGAATFLLVQGYLLSTKGQTVGKLVMKTRIVSQSTGQILPIGDLIVKRYLIYWVLPAVPFVGNFLIALFALVNALMIFRENHRCLHDEIAGTNVVKIQ